MSILVDESTRLLVQGMGREGRFHAEQAVDYGTRYVGGVNPGRGGGAALGRPLFNTVAGAVADTGANTSIIFVPAPFAADAICEAVDAGIGLIVCITDGIPVLDMVTVRRYMAGKSATLIGPNCPGVISPGKAKVGITPGHIHQPGRVGVISRSGTLTYEAVAQLTARGIGQSTCVGIGGDPIGGLNFVQCLGAVRGGRGYRRDCSDRRDRRPRRRRKRPPTSPSTSASRWSDSLPDKARRRAAAWATPGRSSTGRAAPRPRKWRLWKKADSRSCAAPPASARRWRTCWPGTSVSCQF